MLSSQPDIPAEAPPWLDWPGADKLAHGLLYGGLAFIVWLGLVRSDAGAPIRLRVAGPVAFATAYGLTDEIHQWFVPLRSLDPLDLLADGAGATIVVVALELWRRRARRSGGTPGHGR